jgi:hypothetical protein
MSSHIEAQFPQQGSIGDQMNLLAGLMGQIHQGFQVRVKGWFTFDVKVEVIPIRGHLVEDVLKVSNGHKLIRSLMRGAKGTGQIARIRNLKVNAIELHGFYDSKKKPRLGLTE